MAIVAYSGHPDERIFTRVTFSTWEQARIAVWNDSALYGLHDTDAERTYWDNAWDGESQPQPRGQLDLFGAGEGGKNG